MQRNQEDKGDNPQYQLAMFIPLTDNVNIISSIGPQQYDWNHANPIWLAVLADEASRKIPLPILSPFNSQDIPLDPKFIEGHIDVGSKFSIMYLFFKMFYSIFFFLILQCNKSISKEAIQSNSRFLYIS